MKIYLAGDVKYPAQNRRFDYYRLESFFYFRDSSAHFVPKYKDFILDSGVFTFLNQKREQVDWYRYAARYAEFVKKHRIKNYVEIDVDSYIGLAEVEKLRAYLEKAVGWRSMPVWHIGRGWDDWAKLCREYDYICFGAFLTDGLDKKQYKNLPIFLNEAEKRNCRVHGLGFTNMAGLKRYRFHSVDSTTWLMGNRAGNVYFFRNNTMRHIKKPKGSRMYDIAALERHNLNEWIKFSNYAETNL